MCSYKFTFFFVFDLAHIKIQWCSVLIRGVCMVMVVFLGSAATQLRWCYRPNYHFVRYKFLVVTVKKLLKSVFSALSYAYTKKTPTFLAHPVYYVYIKALRHGSHSFTCKYTMPAANCGFNITNTSAIRQKFSDHNSRWPLKTMYKLVMGDRIEKPWQNLCKQQ